MTDTTLPQGWARGPIGDLIAPDGVFVDGDWVESKDQDPSGDVRLIQLADIGDGRFVDKSHRFLTSAKAQELRCTFLEQGDVLIARMPDPLGRACVFPGDSKEAITVVDVCIVRPNTDAVNCRWLMHFVNAPRFRVAVAGLQSGSTRQRISRGNLATLQLPIPPTNEQRRIVAKIDELFSDLDAGVAALQRVAANLKRYRASVLNAAVDGSLTAEWRATHAAMEPASALLQCILDERRATWERDQQTKAAASGKPLPANWKTKYKEPIAPDTTDLPALPEGWCWASVAQIGFVQLGRQRAPQHHRGLNMRPYLRVANVFEDRIDTTDVMEMNFTPQEYANYKLEPHDILLNEGQSMELIGRPAMYRGEVPGACFTNTLVRFRACKGLLPEYALLVFLAYLKNGRFQRIAKITVNLAHLGAERFAALEFPLPTQAEQRAIVEEMERRMSLIRATTELLQNGSRRASRLRQSVLGRAFSGGLVAQAPSDEPASVLLERIRAQQAGVAGAQSRASRPRQRGLRKVVEVTE